MVNKIYDDLLACRLVKVNGSLFSIYDFISGYDIDECYFASLISGDCRDFTAHAKSKLMEFASELAAKKLEGDL